MGGDHAAAISGGTPSCANAHYLRGVLRKAWGWEDGYIVSDCQAIAIIKAGHGFRTAEDPHAVPKSQIHGDTDQSDYVDAARQAIRASTDFNCGQAYRGFLEDVVVDGTVDESMVDESLTRMYSLMLKLGIVIPVSEDKADGAYSGIGPADIDTEHNRAIAREAAAAAMTLLKNDGILPLKLPTGGGKKIAVIGPLANATLGMLSNYHPNSAAQVPVAMSHSPLQALLARGVSLEHHQATNVECETPQYCQESDRANISAAVAAAKRAEHVLLFLGMNPNGNNGTGAEFGGQGSSETEAKDRYDIKLRGVQQELLERVVAANPKTVRFLTEIVDDFRRFVDETWRFETELWTDRGADERGLPRSERVPGAGRARFVLPRRARRGGDRRCPQRRRLASRSLADHVLPGRVHGAATDAGVRRQSARRHHLPIL